MEELEIFDRKDISAQGQQKASLVSIILPVYNAEKSIGRCLDSILSQDYENIEVLVIDDGSSDQSWQIISEYSRKDSRIVAIQKSNSGVSSTRNRGLQLARGKYIQFIDSDDWLPFDSTKLLVREMEKNNAQMVIGDFYRVVGDTMSKKGSIETSGLISRNQYADYMLTSPADFYYGVLWNKLYSRQIIEQHQILMDENISYCEDIIFNLEYLMHVDNIYVTRSPVYYYALTEGSLVQKNLNIQDTVKMKTSVISYYNNFYRNILSPEDYHSRQLSIYGYLLAISTDAFNIPFIGTRKLGQETGSWVFYDENLEGSSLLHFYLSNALFSRFLNTLAQKYRLELSDMKVLYVLYLYKRGCSSEELSSLCAMSTASILVSLGRLLASGYISIDSLNIFEGATLLFSYRPGSLDGELQQCENDFRSVCFSGFSEQEKQLYLSLREKIASNLKKMVVASSQNRN